MTTSNKAQMIRLQFMKKLVAKYKEGTIVTLTEMNAVRDQNFDKFENALIFIRKSGLYKVGRNQYMVTLSKNPLAEIYKMNKSAKAPTEITRYTGRGKKRLVHLRAHKVSPSAKLYLAYYANEKKFHSQRAH